MTTKKKLSRGRPAFVPDLKQIETLSAMQCSDGEIAAVIGCSKDTMIELKKKPEVFEAMTRGREMGKTSLRRAQWNAVSKGNITMMIWLGKQWLDQSDKSEVKSEITGADGEPLMPTVIRLVGPKTLPAPIQNDSDAAG